MSYKVETEPD